MSYSGISVREALDKINCPNNGWYLPQFQRQYVLGAPAHQSENYIFLLLNSLIKRYPIGGIVVRETEQSVPYRQFVGDYSAKQYAVKLDGSKNLALAAIF